MPPAGGQPRKRRLVPVFVVASDPPDTAVRIDCCDQVSKGFRPPLLTLPAAAGLHLPAGHGRAIMVAI